MEQNCYKFEEGAYYTIVHFSAIAGWHIMENDLQYPGYTPFDQNRLNFPTTSDRSVYEAWLRFKNGDVGLEITGQYENKIDPSTSDEHIVWDNQIIEIEEIKGWLVDQSGESKKLINLSPILQNDVELPSITTPYAILQLKKWRAWQKRVNGIDYPPIN